jgi:hypothetical protein
MIQATHPIILPYAVAGGASLRPSVEDQILDFLDGRTHGENLLHALYDHILDEPIPDQMRGLFSAKPAGCAESK